MKQEYDELDRSQDVFFLCSGGRDSTAMVLLAWEQGLEEATLVFGDTRLNRIDALGVVERLSAKTGYPYEIVSYSGEQCVKDVLVESFKRIPQAVAYMREHDIFRRNMFPCCEKLKHGPMNDFVQSKSDNAVFMLGLKGSDSAIHRIYRMNQLREWNTFYRKHKSTGLLYYYPLRDWTEEQVNTILRKYGFQNIHSTGCRICPIFCLFPSWRERDPETWRRSVEFADRLNIEDHPMYGQQFLDTICPEIVEG
jgi:3'-phosphoadenosine 5'-phosphosulfate sulfotransferase (PAPS reductase)/FAD synthetase